MAWTYTALPATVPADAVRLLLGDTDSTDPLVQDGEIAFALSTEINAFLAAAFCADNLAARYTRDESISADGVSVSGASRAQAFRLLASNLRARGARNVVSTDQSRPSASVIATGLRPADMARADADPTRIPSAFVRMDESNPSLLFGVMPGAPEGWL